ncbi:response regulator transcription factor [Serratia sp. Ag2]|uniref:response regulator transcription factor n=1 Tax=Serratia sp. Ag2 TaxID=1532556 RepID=UPI00050857F7|nr:LuxR C-terminal-related transcriptional regulator [Serratia sp. Ag2]KFK95690.1 hypothetical protein JV45_06870 [Serratia sp. Ag2]
MNSRIFIALWDSDLFLLQGIKYLLTGYFQAKDMTVAFIPVAGSNVVDLSVIDLVIGGEFVGKQNRPDRQNISIVRHIFGRRNLYQYREISRNEKPETVVYLLNELFNTVTADNLLFAQGDIKISPREQEVLQGIAKELTPLQIAGWLNISVKTVSAHKRVAMRKLGLRNTNELYKWLLEGGLNSGTENR